MTIINYDSDKIINKSVISLKNATLNLKYASRIINSANIPNSFSQKKYLNSLSFKINNEYNNIINFIDNIIVYDKKYNSIIEEFKEEIKNIESIIISKRQEYIKK